MVEMATSLAVVPVARTFGPLAVLLSAPCGPAMSASLRSAPMARSSTFPTSAHLVLGATELALPGCRAATRRGLV